MKVLNLIFICVTAFSLTACTLELSENSSTESGTSIPIDLEGYLGPYSGVMISYSDTGFFGSMPHEGKILKDDTGTFYTDLMDVPLDSIQYFFKWRINQLVEYDLDTTGPIYTYKISTTVKGDSFIRVFEEIHKFPDTAKESYFKHITRMIKDNK